ncbi:MAG: hypothetical protein ACKVWR_03185 [Acidimicrobiales bacterium]
MFEERFGLTGAELDHEYRGYEPQSRFVCVVDEARSLAVGAARLILPGSEEPKSLHDLRSRWGVTASAGWFRNSTGIELSATWDVASLAVLPGYRKQLVSLALYQGICTTARLCGAMAFLAILDLAVLRLLQHRLASGFEQLPGVGAEMYMGSTSLPVWAGVKSWIERLEAKDPNLCATVFYGEHLEPVVSPPEWSRRGLAAWLRDSAPSPISETPSSGGRG